jgi:hypothetical protein
MVSETLVKKRKWMESQLSHIDPDEVEQTLKVSVKALTRLMQHSAMKQNPNTVKVG